MQKISYSQLILELKNEKYFVVDSKVVSLYPELREFLGPKVVWILDNPEKQKTILAYSQISEFFLINGISRRDKIVVIGGGASSDLGGFVASTLLRGIHWIVVPTTLLAMVDASIGGKTGVNTDQGKNLIGSFHLPCETYICSKFLETLTTAELSSGAGEVLKYLYLADEVYEAFGEKLENNLIEACAKYKMRLVEEDFKELGPRKLLNLGHTFGHAIEKMTEFSHGQCVAIGIKWMMHIFSPHLIPSYEKMAKVLLVNIDETLSLDFDKFSEFVKKDKKKVNDTELEIIVPVSIGESQIQLVTFEELLNKLKQSELYESNFK